MNCPKVKQGYSLRDLLVVILLVCVLLALILPLIRASREKTRGRQCVDNLWDMVHGPQPLPGCSENHGINNPLQSVHPGGLLVGFVDGSVKFVASSNDLAVLLRLAIRNDGQNVTFVD